jgi:hypothetical protein
MRRSQPTSTSQPTSNATEQPKRKRAVRRPAADTGPIILDGRFNLPYVRPIPAAREQAAVIAEKICGIAMIGAHREGVDDSSWQRQIVRDLILSLLPEEDCLVPVPRRGLEGSAREAELQAVDEAGTLLIVQALRVDGYAWARQHAPEQDVFATLAALAQSYARDGVVPSEPVAAMALNFYLHRTYRHWGDLPRADSEEGVRMVLLYLHTYRLPTPAAFRHESARDWEQVTAEEAERVAAAIRKALA